MITWQRSTVVVGLALLVTAVGAIETIAEGVWDLAVVFGLLVLLQALILFGQRKGRAMVPLRRDLVEWLTAQSAATGEPLDRLVDRSVAAYRTGLTAEPRPER